MGLRFVVIFLVVKALLRREQNTFADESHMLACTVLRGDSCLGTLNDLLMFERQLYIPAWSTCWASLLIY